MAKPVFIYALRDPRCGTARYVGRTESLRRRLRAHIRAPTNQKMDEWIGELRAAGLEPAIDVLAEVDADHADSAEVEWIERLAPTLLNASEYSTGGKRKGAGRKSMPPDAKAALARLELLTGLSREEILIAGVHALERELSQPKRREGPAAVVA